MRDEDYRKIKSAYKAAIKNKDFPQAAYYSELLSGDYAAAVSWDRFKGSWAVEQWLKSKKTQDLIKSLEADNQRFGWLRESDRDKLKQFIRKCISESVEEPLYVEYHSQMTGEVPFMMGGKKYEYVWAKYPNGKRDIGVYSFAGDVVYDYEAFRKMYNLKESESKNERFIKEVEGTVSVGDVDYDYQATVEGTVTTSHQPHGEDYSEIDPDAIDIEINSIVPEPHKAVESLVEDAIDESIRDKNMWDFVNESDMVKEIQNFTMPKPEPKPVKTIDVTGKKCVKCKKGTYGETSLYSDWHGTRSCSSCGHTLPRYSTKDDLLKENDVETADTNPVKAAKDWILDCAVNPEDEENIIHWLSTATDEQVKKYVNRTFDGGWNGFLNTL